MATTQLPIEGVFDTDTGKLVGFDAGSGAVAEIDITATSSRTSSTIYVTDYPYLAQATADGRMA